MYINEQTTFSDLLKETKLHKSKLLIELLRKHQSLNRDEELRELIYILINNNITYQNYPVDCKMIFVADLHFASKYENVEYMHRVYEFAIRNNIKDVYILGDLVEAIPWTSKREYNTHQEQLTHFIKHYPYDKNIHNYALLGNHDYMIEKQSKINVNEYLENNRKDFTSIGYKRATIEVLNKNICLKHEVEKLKNEIPHVKPNITFKGHGHFYKIREGSEEKPPTVYVPHLSDMNKLNGYDPGFILAEFHEENGKTYVQLQNYKMTKSYITLHDEKVLELKDCNAYTYIRKKESR